MERKKKTLLVGLDAACWDYMNPLLRAGSLPTLGRLMDTGVSGVLHSTLPAMTPTAWGSIITGKNPGKHGVFGMMWREPGTCNFSPSNALVRRGTPFWQRLNGRGIRVGLVNVPFTNPPDSIEGFVVGGFGTPSTAPDITYPLQLLKWIEEQYGSYRPEVDVESFIKSGSLVGAYDAERSHQRRQVELAVRLADRFKVDVLVINLMLFDHANHTQPEMRQVQQAMCDSDADIETLIGGFHPDNVLLISDHGSRRLKGRFLLYNWLLDQGYCKQVERTPSDRSDALNWLITQRLKALGWSGLPEKLVRHLTREFLLRLPDSASRGFWNLLERSLPFSHEYVLFTDQTDMSRSAIFTDLGTTGSLYFNASNREARGFVSGEEQLSLGVELSAKLKEVLDPYTGQPIFSNVFMSKDIYAGEEAKDAPDVILDEYESSWLSSQVFHVDILKPRRHRYFIEEASISGWHSRDGIFIFSGEDFKLGHASTDGHVMDIPAMLLHLHGVPIPEDYDGNVLLEVMKSEFMQRYPVTYQPGDFTTAEPLGNPYSQEESEELTERLRALGYVD